ncbi:MAG: DUF2062 domain-containing protein [Labilithrix sp.]|nr:DUF2062 domain-containing protein [Labilithrix sp.]
MLRRLWQRIKHIWKLAKSERASPREIGWAVGIGAFAGCTPAIGVHGPLAMGLATIFKKNRLFAWLGSRISNMIMLPFIAVAEVQVAHLIRTGTWLDIELDRHNALDQAGALLLDWCIGTVPVGGAIGFVMGFAAYGVARRRDERRKRAEAEIAANETNEAIAATPPTPAEDPRPSSESPA